MGWFTKPIDSPATVSREPSHPHLRWDEGRLLAVQEQYEQAEANFNRACTTWRSFAIEHRRIGIVTYQNDGTRVVRTPTMTLRERVLWEEVVRCKTLRDSLLSERADLLQSLQRIR
jgi:hypothetical protein